MNKSEIFGVIIIAISIAVIVLFFVGVLKDARESMSQLKAHEDIKKKNKIP